MSDDIKQSVLITAEFADYRNPGPRIVFREHRVLKDTPGQWKTQYRTINKSTRLTGYDKYYLSREEAVECIVARYAEMLEKSIAHNATIEERIAEMREHEAGIIANQTARLERVRQAAEAAQQEAPTAPPAEERR